MPEPSADLAVAAHLLAQWAQVRQSVWRDRSSDGVAKRIGDIAAPGDLNPGAAPAPTGPTPASLTLPSPSPEPTSARSVPAGESPAPAVKSLAPAVSPAFTVGGPIPAAARLAPAPAGAPRVNQPARRLAGSRKSPSRRGATLALRLAACAAGVLAIAAPAVWLAGRSAAAPAPAVPVSGRVLLSSSPSGSSVFIDGVDSGKTPLTATLPPGQHTIEYRYRRNVRRIQLTVVAGADVSNLVDWTKRPVAPRRAKPAPHSPQPDANDTKPEALTSLQAGSPEPDATNPKPEARGPEPDASNPKPEASTRDAEAISPNPAAGSPDPERQ